MLIIFTDIKVKTYNHSLIMFADGNNLVNFFLKPPRSFTRKKIMTEAMSMAKLSLQVFSSVLLSSL